MNWRKILSRAIIEALRFVGPRKLAPAPEAELKSILVFRFGGIGDVVATTGLLGSLRRHYPKAKISVATAPHYAPVLEYNRDIDEILVSSTIIPFRGLYSFFGAVRELKRWSNPSVDLAIFTHNFFYMMFLALFVKARYKVGFDTNDRHLDFAMTHSMPIYYAGHPKEREHESQALNEHFQNLLRHFRGENFQRSPPHIEITEQEINWARAELAQRQLRRPLIVIAPGGTSKIKIWPIDRFVKTARHAIDNFNASVVLVGGPDEARLIEHFASLGISFWFAAGELMLRQSLSIIKEASLVIGSDTGLIHAAAALSVPTIAVFGPTPSRVYGQAGPGHVILKSELPCVPCKKEYCALNVGTDMGATPACLNMISAEQVITSLTAVMEGLKEI